VYRRAGRKPSNFTEVNDVIKNYDKNKDGAIDRKEMMVFLRVKMNLC
jgi:Ca2+-binding EF-hand superfamily protein